ncbi:hypothetical protein [Gottfriedia acidiceleris]|uniref:hypothetical protein n=1 Tax=Gottfriedia acidiceleris TaxID=371036 RepID=UPI000B44AEFB|nr:hypothetical protein [Gottfriedia acidiceleris]
MKKAMIVLSVICMFFSFGLGPNATAAATDCKCTALQDKVAKEYIKQASKSDVYKNNVSSKKIEDGQAMLFEAGEKFPEDVVVVSGTVGEDQNNAVQVFITPKDKKIVRVTHIQSEGLNNQDAFTLKSYDSEGNLRATSDGTINDMREGTVTVEKQEVPMKDGISTLSLDHSSLWWACQFSSLLVCLGAAGVNVLLALACRTVFKYFACSNL